VSTTVTVVAHGIGGRQDLPIPFSAAVAGAAVALVVSFVALGLLWRTPLLRGDAAGRPLPAGAAGFLDSAGFRWTLRVAGLVATGYVLVAALLGPDLATNPTARVVFVLLWVGLVPASVLFGPVWRLLNPLRTIHLGISALLRVDPRQAMQPLPRRLGYWPAAIGLFAFVWLELVAPDRTTLPVLRVWFAAYAAIHLVASAWFGSRWFDRGDAFEVYSALFGRLSVLGRRSDGRLVLRSPLNGLAGLRGAPGLVAVVCVLLGSTAYDGLSTAPYWFNVLQGGAASPTVIGTLGLIGMILLVAVTYVAATASAGYLGHVRPAGLPGEFAHSIVPIALGYTVAHYYSLFVIEGQLALVQLSDPLGTGANLLGTAGLAVRTSWITPTSVATIQVVAVVAGHILGVVLAHDRAVRLFPRRQALAGQLPLLVVMVGYTIGGLLLLFAA
jgi:hypothetical protein